MPRKTWERRETAFEKGETIKDGEYEEIAGQESVTKKAKRQPLTEDQRIKLLYGDKQFI